MADQPASTEENLERILAVERSFRTSRKPLKKLGRVLVGEGRLIKLCKRSPQPRVFFLFNDILVYGSIMFNGRLFKDQQVFQLEDIQMEDLEDSPDMKNQWLIRTPRKSFYVSAASPQEKNDWITHIEECRAKRVSEKGPGPVEDLAPSWVPDNASAICMRCYDNKFTVTQRRHHCRRCGYLVCASCSNNRFLIPNISCEPVRVCWACFPILEAIESIRKRGDSDGNSWSDEASSDEDTAESGQGHSSQWVGQPTRFYEAGRTTAVNNPVKNQTLNVNTATEGFLALPGAQKRNQTAKGSMSILNELSWNEGGHDLKMKTRTSTRTRWTM